MFRNIQSRNIQPRRLHISWSLESHTLSYRYADAHGNIMSNAFRTEVRRGFPFEGLRPFSYTLGLPRPEPEGDAAADDEEDLIDPTGFEPPRFSRRPDDDGGVVVGSENEQEEEDAESVRDWRSLSSCSGSPPPRHFSPVPAGYAASQTGTVESEEEPVRNWRSLSSCSGSPPPRYLSPVLLARHADRQAEEEEEEVRDWRSLSSCSRSPPRYFSPVRAGYVASQTRTVEYEEYQKGHECQGECNEYEKGHECQGEFCEYGEGYECQRQCDEYEDDEDEWETVYEDDEVEEDDEGRRLDPNEHLDPPNPSDYTEEDVMLEEEIYPLSEPQQPWPHGWTANGVSPEERARDRRINEAFERMNQQRRAWRMWRRELPALEVVQPEGMWST